MNMKRLIKGRENPKPYIPYELQSVYFGTGNNLVHSLLEVFDIKEKVFTKGKPLDDFCSRPCDSGDRG